MFPVNSQEKKRKSLFSIHGFTISAAVSYYLFFGCCCQETAKYPVNLCFDSRCQQESCFTNTLIYFSIIYFQIGITFQLNYYQ